MASTIVVRWTLLVFTLVMAGAGYSQPPELLVTLKVPGDRSGAVISRDLFEQFAEQLGNGIEGGGCVVRNSSIPNVRGFCSDVVAALRAIRSPTCAGRADASLTKITGATALVRRPSGRLPITLIEATRSS